MKNYYVAEYSVSQDCFHIETMIELVKENLMIAFDGLEVDYIPIGFFETELEANDFIEKVRPEIKMTKDVRQQIKDTVRR